MFDNARTREIGPPMLLSNHDQRCSSALTPMTSPVSSPSPDNAAAARANERSIVICIAAGSAFLIAACWKGVADPQARTLVLCMLTLGIAMFGTSLALLRRRSVRAQPGVEQSPVAAPIAQPVATVEPSTLQVSELDSATNVRPEPGAVSAVAP